MRIRDVSPFSEFEPLPSMRRVAAPPLARKVGIGLALLLPAMVAGLIFVPWQQSVVGTGQVVALSPGERTQEIEAPIEGRILRWNVAEGSVVKQGSLVAEISDNDPGILDRLARERDAIEERLQASRARQDSIDGRIAGLEASRRNALDAAQSRLEMGRDRLRGAEGVTLAATAPLDTARLNLERQKGLHRKGLTPTRSLELAQLDYDRSVAEMDRAGAALSAAKQELAALEADREKAGNDFRALIDDARAARASAGAEIATAKAVLQPAELRLARQSTQKIYAPRNGAVLRLLAQPGSQVLKPGEPVAILVPESTQPVVELWVDGNDMPLVSVGDPVRLQFEGWPAIQFVGWPSVAVGTFPGEVTLVDATGNGQGKFRLLIAPATGSEPWPSRRYLRQGVRVHAWVLLRQVSLGFELWRQWNGFPPVIAPGEPGVSDKGKQEK